MLTSSRRSDRWYRKCTGDDAGAVLLSAIFLGCTARRRNFAKARWEHLPRRDVGGYAPPDRHCRFRFRLIRFCAARRECDRRLRTVLSAPCDLSRLWSRAFASCVDQDSYPNYDHRSSRKKEIKERVVRGLLACSGLHSTREARIINRVNSNSFPEEESIN